MSLLFSFSVIVLVFATTFTEETIGYILSFNIFFLLLAIGFRILALILWGLRIVLMSRSLGYRVGLLYSLNMVLAGLLAGTITPGQAGGEPVRVHELFRAGVKIGDATAVVIMERVLDGIILTIMGIIIMLMTREMWSTFSTSLIILIIVAWVFLMSFLFIPFLAIRYPSKMKYLILRFISWITGKLSKTRLSSSRICACADTEIDNFFESITRFTGSSGWGLIAGGGATALFWITEFLVASVILMGLGLEPYIVLSFFFQILIAIIMMIPTTPGSSGITELSTSSLYALIVPAGMLGIFVLLWRFVTFYLNIILGTIAGMFIVHREIKTRADNNEEEQEEAEPETK
ncbi:flippase-like domain-containing protein [Methanospirillum stamsii]|uniref:flippase-like domain-containing protein n=1 Tax=Methanospirillum stamsii TaxID=1277351 RepID=UPI00248221CD|nr:flippase-like domain-containing protein [Methanospirillum stamsii]